LIFVLVQRHVTFKLTVFHLQQMNSASYEESTDSPTWGLFFITISACAPVFSFAIFYFLFSQSTVQLQV